MKNGNITILSFVLYKRYVLECFTGINLSLFLGEEKIIFEIFGKFVEFHLKTWTSLIEVYFLSIFLKNKQFSHEKMLFNTSQIS